MKDYLKKYLETGHRAIIIRQYSFMVLGDYYGPKNWDCLSEFDFDTFIEQVWKIFTLLQLNSLKKMSNPANASTLNLMKEIV